MESASGPDVKPAAGFPPPDNPLTIYQRMRENALKGRDMNVGGFLEDLDELTVTGAIDKLPALRNQILEVGQDPLLWLGAYTSLRDSISANDPPQIQKGLSRAHYLGMDQVSADPRRQAVAEQIIQWREEIATAGKEPEVIQPTEERLAGAQLIAAEVRRLMAQHHISEGEAIERLKGIKNPGRRRLLMNTLKLGVALTAAAAVGRLTAPSVEPVTQAGQTTEGPKPPEQQVNLFNEIMKPFIDEAMRRRAERAKTDPEYSHRVDSELNRDRVNFVIFGYGDTYEPPAAQRAIIGSQTIYSFDLNTQTIDQISLTHDIRAPEIERFQKARGQKGTPTKIDRAYDIGGFDLMRQVVEDATGFSADFQIALKDVNIKKAVDNVFNGLEVDVPFDLDTQPFWLEGHLYPEGRFSKGKQTMDGTKVMQFIKALPQTYDRTKERNVRKHHLMRSLLNSLKGNLKNPLFLARGAMHLRSSLGNQEVAGDFDADKLLAGNLVNLAKSAIFGKTEIPQTRKEFYIVDGSSGDGGVMWVTASDSIYSRNDLKNGVYVDLAMAVPVGNANPYAKDLVDDYWKPVRELIKKGLSQNG